MSMFTNRYNSYLLIAISHSSSIWLAAWTRSSKFGFLGNTNGGWQSNFLNNSEGARQTNSIQSMERGVSSWGPR